MSKYVYCNGKIYCGLDAEECPQKKNEDISYWINRDHIEFDNFEDLIEAGDLIHYYTVDHIEQVTELYDNKIVTTNCRCCSIYDKNINEIWKLIDNMFIRVCHKEKGQWVIDNE